MNPHEDELEILGVKSAKLGFAALAVAGILLFLFGCQTIGTPPGYEADTTPGHNGEAWVGGETPPATK